MPTTAQNIDGGESFAERTHRRVQQEADEAQAAADISLVHKWASHAGSLTNDLHRVRQTALAVGAFGLVDSIRRQIASSSGGRPMASSLQLYQDSDAEYFKLFSLTAKNRLGVIPRRHLGWASHSVLRNCFCGLRNGALALVAYPCNGFVSRGTAGVPLGMLKGVSVASLYLSLGFIISPLWHGLHGAINQCISPVNVFRGDLTFDASKGRYIGSNVEVNRQYRKHMELESQLIIGVGQKEFELRKRALDASLAGQAFRKKLRQLVSSNKGPGNAKKPNQPKDEFDVDEDDDHYQVLQVKRSASTHEVKAAYQQLAKVFHPDRNPGDKAAAEHFHKVQAAYKVLADPVKRKQYDRAGHRGTKLSADSGSLLDGTPHDILTRMFGGRPIKERLLGPIYISPIHMRNQALTNVTLTEFEMLQTLRFRLLTVEYADMLDVFARAPDPPQDPHERDIPGFYAHRAITKKPTTTTRSSLGSSADPLFNNSSKKSGGDTNNYEPIEGADQLNAEFREKAELYVKRLGQCSFGPEIMYEVGGIFEVVGLRHLKRAPWYAPKLNQLKTVFSGANSMKRLIEASGQKDIGKQHVIGFFDMEWDNLRNDIHVVVRFAACAVLKDRSLNLMFAEDTAKIRRKRAKALVYLGRLMKQRGQPWGMRKDEELIYQLRVVAKSDANLKPMSPFKELKVQ